MAAGGDIVEINWTHDVYGSGSFSPKSSEDNDYEIGGFRPEDNQKVSAGGAVINSMQRVAGFLSVVIVNDMNIKKDLETLSLLASSPKPTTWTFEVVNGVKYFGKGFPQMSNVNINAATLKLKVVTDFFTQLASASAVDGRPDISNIV